MKNKFLLYTVLALCYPMDSKYDVFEYAKYLCFIWRFSLAFVKSFKFCKCSSNLFKTSGFQIGCFQACFWKD